MALAQERLSPIGPETADFEQTGAFVFQVETEGFAPIKDVNRVPLTLLKGKRSNGRGDAATGRAVSPASSFKT